MTAVATTTGGLITNYVAGNIHLPIILDSEIIVEKVELYVGEKLQETQFNSEFRNRTRLRLKKEFNG